MLKSVQIKIPSKYRIWVRIGLIAVPIVSIVAAALTLPPQISIPISVGLVITSILLNRFVFVHTVLLVMPGPTEEMVRFWIGTCWYAEDMETMEGLGIGIVYKYRSAAQHAYHMLKAWNYGKLIDDEGNITASFINEGGGRYSVLFYPGERVQSQIAAQQAVSEDLSSNSEVEVQRMHFYMYGCLDYSNDETKQRMVESLPRIEYLQLNTFYIENNDLKAFAKRPFKLKRFKYALRDDQNLGELEKLTSWSDPVEGKPKDVIETVERVRKTIQEPGT